MTHTKCPLFNPPDLHFTSKTPQMLTNCSQHWVDPATFPRSPPPPKFDLHINLITPPKCSQNCYSLLTTHADPDGLVEKAQPLHQLRLPNLLFTLTVPLQNVHQNTHSMLTTLADPTGLIPQNSTSPPPSSSKFTLHINISPPKCSPLRYSMLTTHARP